MTPVSGLLGVLLGCELVVVELFIVVALGLLVVGVCWANPKGTSSREAAIAKMYFMFLPQLHPLRPGVTQGPQHATAAGCGHRSLKGLSVGCAVAAACGLQVGYGD